MSAKVVTVTSGKGGVGKTQHLRTSSSLASLGYKVVCLDVDIGLRKFGCSSRIGKSDCL